MGAVYEVEQPALKRSLALKMLDVRLDDGLMNDARLRERFVREASLLAGLDHPNTVRVYDYGVEGQHPYLVMELVRGVTLRHLMAAGRLPALRLVRLLRQVCASVHQAHEQGLIHRDLKPANILVVTDQAQDVVKVVDFGLVKQVDEPLDEITGGGKILGTPQYMAPEQIRDDDPDRRCDIYAMGVLLFKGLTDAYPFPQKGGSKVLMAHLTQIPSTLAEADPHLAVPSLLQWTVTQCLRKRREDRFADAGELQRALKLCEAALLDESTATLARPALVEGRLVVTPVSAPPASSRALWMSLAGFSVVLLVMLLGLAVGYGAALAMGVSLPSEAL